VALNRNISKMDEEQEELKTYFGTRIILFLDNKIVKLSKEWEDADYEYK